MGKNKDNKKKGKGAEKTLAKTEKKLSNKLKKDLHAIGEDDIENILAEIEREDKKRLQVIESVIDAPSRRVNFTFAAHPEKEQLILYGGEFFDGQKTFVYGDLFFYTIPNGTWTVVKAPNGPPPRCGHQMVVTSAEKGQLWVFGGEFVSPSQSQFYHYKDLWVYHMATKLWEKVTAPGGPSARSGHRMVLVKKRLVTFGGFHDNVRDYKYFNDVYSFDMESYKWSKVEAMGTPPSPRSGCCMVALPNGKILVYGGYSKERVKKDVDKGHIYADAFLLCPDKTDTTFTKFKWVQANLGGIRFSSRCSMPMVAATNALSAYCFGGVYDVEEDDEEIAGNFFNDMYQLDLEKLTWRSVQLSSKKSLKGASQSCAATSEEKQMEVETVDTVTQKVNSTVISDDGIFTVTVGPTPSTSIEPSPTDAEDRVFRPSPRINCGLAIKHGVLYLYGGMFEDGDKQITLNDFFSLDLKKLDEWKVLKEDEKAALEWLGEESDNEEGEDDEGEDGDSEESGMSTD